MSMLQLELDKTIRGAALEALWDACFAHADVFSLCTSVWTHATNDALRRALEPHRLRSFRTARWFCHISTEPFLQVNLYPANDCTRRIVRQHVTDLYFDLSRNRDLHTLEDLCFFRDDRLFFGTVSHEQICMAQPPTQEFASLLQNLGRWSNHDDRFAQVSLSETEKRSKAMTSKQNWIVGSSSSSVHAATPEVVHAFAKAGIQAMEISLPWDQYDTIDFAALKKASDETGVQLWSLHLPFDGKLSIAHADPAVRERSVKTNLELMKKAADVGIAYSVIHPGTEPTAPADRAERLKESAENLHLLAEAGLSMGMTLCIEDLPRTCPGNCAKEMAYLLSAHPALRSCFDTNHLLGESHEEYLNAVGSSIVTLHVSDYDFIDERHQLPGEGMVDWKSVMAKLESLGYNGPWMYEVLFEPMVNRRTGPQLYLEDLVKNFNWLKTL